jgi:hypothetical protein
LYFLKKSEGNTMKVKTKTLVAFLKKSRMDGSQAIGEAILRFGKEGLKINANSEAKQARVMSWLKTNAFVEYEELGNVGMNDLNNVIKVLDRFGEQVSIKKEGNLLTVIGEGKKVDIELVSESFLDTETGEPALEFDETFTVPMTTFNSIFNDIKINKDAIMTIETIEKKVKITNTGKYKFVNEIAAPSCKGGVKVSMGEPFIDAISNLDGVLEVSIKSDYPAKIMEKTETSVITIIVAPRVGEEEAEA